MNKRLTRRYGSRSKPGKQSYTGKQYPQDQKSKIKAKANKTKTQNHKENAATEKGAQRLNTHGKEN